MLVVPIVSQEDTLLPLKPSTQFTQVYRELKVT